MKELLTIEDLAKMTGLSERTIRNYLAGGQLEGEKVDGAWRFTEEQFGTFLGQDMVQVDQQKELRQLQLLVASAWRRHRMRCMEDKQFQHLIIIWHHT